MNQDLFAYRSEADRLVDEFYLWELRGRGIQVWGLPVHPEPLFERFPGRRPAALPSPQIEIPPPLLVRWFRRIEYALFGAPPAVPPPLPPAVDPAPKLPDRSFFDFREKRDLVELEFTLASTEHVSRDLTEQFLLSTSFCTRPLSFEVIGSAEAIRFQFVADAADAERVEQQLVAHFPGAVVAKHDRLLADLFLEPEEPHGTFFAFRLAHEFMRPLGVVRNLNADPLVGITGALTGLRGEEVGVLQVIFQPAKHPWAESMLRAAAWEDGTPFLDPALVSQTRQKTSRPLFAAVIRVLGQSSDARRGEEIARGLAAALSPFSDPSANQLIPLENHELEFMEVCLDAVYRRTRHSGMILNSDEVVSLVHPPSPAVSTRKFRRQTGKTRRAPDNLLAGEGLLIGENEHSGEAASVRLSADERVRHMHCIGASGTGKSTLLFNLIRQDIDNGEGVAVLDPHGDLADKLLGIIPSERVEDVVFLNPSDEEYSIGFNMLSAHSELEKNLLASDLVSVFQRLSASWGDQMGSVLNHAIRAFLESSRGGTLADLRRFLLEPGFRNEFLKTVADPEIVYYWRQGFAQLAGNKSIGPVLTRLETFLSPKPIRYMVSQAENRLDFDEIMDTGKIFLAKLAQGEIGKENSYLLGSLLLAKFQQTAMSRQRRAVRRDFWLYVDEFHNFITPSMTEILAGARKYRLGLVLAHQELRQLDRDREVSSAVSTCHTRIVFRVGDDDARKLAEGFASFEPRDLQNLETGQAVCRVERSDHDFNLSVPFPEDEDPAEADNRRAEVITASREKYGTPRGVIEAELRRSRDEPPGDSGGKPDAPPPAPRPRQPTPAFPPPIIDIEPAAPPPAETKTVSKQPPADMGRGGAQHQAIQQRLKAVGESLGFRAVIEQEILDGQGSVDLVLEKPNCTIACEIAITTTIDHEVGNVAKCLKAGFGNVAVIAASEDRLRKLEAAVKNSLGSPVRASFFLPDQFIAWLQSQTLQDSPPPPTEERRRGYKVTHSIVRLSPEELKAREAEAIRLVAESMKRRGKK